MFSRTVTSSAVLYEEIDFGKKKEENKDEKNKSKRCGSFGNWGLGIG